jgi:ribonuclease P protein component
MLTETGRFRRSDRILRSREFSYVLKHGERRGSCGFVLVLRESDDIDGAGDKKRRRLGVTVSKRVGNAVVRNRVKRGIREWFRRTRAGLPEETELVVIARPAARSMSASKIMAILDSLVTGWLAEEF